jgi:HEAT repeat protein
LNEFRGLTVDTIDHEQLDWRRFSVQPKRNALFIKGFLSMRHFPALSLLTAFILGGTSISKVEAAEGQAVIFVSTTIQTGVSDTSVLIPRTVAIGGTTLRSRIEDLFGAMREAAGDRYTDINLVFPEGFDLSQSVQVHCEQVNPQECDLALSETGLTFRNAGVAEVVMEPGNVKADLNNLAQAAAVPLIPFWATLPPAGTPHNRYVRHMLGLVRMADSYFTTSEFAKMLGRRDNRIRAAAKETLRNGNATARITIAQNNDAFFIRDANDMLPLLSHGSAKVRLVGVQQVSKRPGPQFLNRCKNIVDQDSDPEVKLAAVRALVTAGRDEYKVYLLMEDLRDPSEQKVLRALDRLVKTGDKRISPSLLPLLSHGSDSVRNAATDGLITLKANNSIVSAVGQTNLDGGLKSRLARALSNISGNEDSRDTGLGLLLSSTDEDDVTFALTKIGEKGIRGHEKKILDQLEKGTEGVKLAAINVAVALKLEKAVPMLSDLAKGDDALSKKADEGMIGILSSLGLRRIASYAENPDAHIRAAALRALGQLGNSASGKSSNILLARIGDDDLNIRQAAVSALNKIANRRIVDSLLTKADDPDPTIRALILEAAIRVQHPEAAARAQKGLGDPADSVKLEAVKGVHTLQVKAALPELWQRIRYGNPDVKRAVVAAIVALADDSERQQKVNTLVELFYDQDPAIKLLIIQSVWGFRDPMVLAQLGSLISMNNPKEVQLKALEALSITKDPRAVEYVAYGMNADDTTIRMAALESLRTINSLQAEPVLRDFVKNEDNPALRKKAIEIMDGLTGS